MPNSTITPATASTEVAASDVALGETQPAKTRSKRTKAVIAASCAVLVAGAAMFGGVTIANNLALTNAQDALSISQETLSGQINGSVQARNELNRVISTATTFKVSVEKLIEATKGAVDEKTATAVAESLKAFDGLDEVEGSPALTVANVDGGTTAAELDAATAKADELIDQRDASIAATDAKTQKIADEIAATNALLIPVAESVPAAAKTLVQAKTSADAASKTAFEAAAKDVAAAVKAGKPAAHIAALAAFGLAAQALTASHDAVLAAEAARLTEEAANSGSGGYADPSTGVYVPVNPGGGGGGTAPVTFTTNGYYTPGCDGFPYGSHSPGAGGTSVVTFGFPWDAYASGQTVYFIACL